jgi:hypothetical protein
MTPIDGKTRPVGTSFKFLRFSTLPKKPCEHAENVVIPLCDSLPTLPPSLHGNRLIAPGQILSP